MHTKLVLSADGGSRAKLEEAVGGFCEIAVFPNARSYKLRLAGTGCGSKTYTGSFRKGGKQHKVTITDHRTRTCRDLVPAKIIVEETVPGFPGAITMTKYSNDRAASRECPAPGSLFNCMPPTSPDNTACGADRSWIQESCPGVQYLD